MSPWAILGLDSPTNDLKAIKRAYAKKLRVTRPDDDPEGFMALRRALENAQFAAQYQVFEDAQETPEIFIAKEAAPVVETTGEIKGEIKSEMDEDPAVFPENAGVLPDAEHMMSEIKALFSDTFGRTQTARWHDIFDDPRLDGIDTAIDFEDGFRTYLLEEFGYFEGDPKLANRNRQRPLITSRIGTLIFNKMGWRNIEGRPLYIQDQITWLRTDLDVINRDRPHKQVQSDIDYVDQHFETNGDENGFPYWVISIVLFGIYTAAKLLDNTFSNSGF